MSKVKKIEIEKAFQTLDFVQGLIDVVKTHPCQTTRDFGLSIIYFHNNETEKSLEHLLVLAKAYPDIHLIHRRIGLIYFALEQYEEAIKAFRKEVALTKQNTRTRMLICLCYFGLNDCKGGKKEFKDLKEYLIKKID